MCIFVDLILIFLLYSSKLFFHIITYFHFAYWELL